SPTRTFGIAKFPPPARAIAGGERRDLRRAASAGAESARIDILCLPWNEASHGEPEKPRTIDARHAAVGGRGSGPGGRRRPGGEVPPGRYPVRCPHDLGGAAHSRR